MLTPPWTALGAYNYYNTSQKQLFVIARRVLFPTKQSQIWLKSAQLCMGLLRFAGQRTPPSVAMTDIVMIFETTTI